jgi:diguanylate cyclase (GGDEF)-like protein/PAS domain S-box-containing protein
VRTTEEEAYRALAGHSDEWFRRIVETADEGVWAVDPELRTVFANRRMAEMLGTTAEAMRGAPVFDFMNETSAALAREFISEQHASPSVQRREFKLRHRDGSEIWTRLSATPIHDAEGAFEGVVALITDVTQEREVEELLRYNEQRLTLLFEVSSDIMAILGADGAWYASPAGTRILGYPIGWDPEGGILSLVHPDDLELAARSLDEVLSGDRAKHEPVRLRLRHVDGHYLWFDCTAENQMDNPTVNGVIIIARDVTDQKVAEEAQAVAEARFRATFERSPLGVALTTLDGIIIDVNAAFSALAGRREDQLIDTDMRLLVHPDDRERVTEESTKRALGQLEAPPAPARILQPSGRIVWMMNDVSVVTNQEGEAEYAIVMTADVTESKKLEERLEFQASHDPLTQLANRALLRSVLENAWARRTEPGHLAILFVDLDRFKQVNDTFGHEAGDELLLLVARRLERSVRVGDAVARFGGDEFVVICENVAGREEAVQIAGRIRESLARTYRLSSGEASVAACVGIALDDEQDSVDNLLREADMAAYRAKDLGRNRVELARRDRADAMPDGLVPGPGLGTYPSQSPARSNR